MVSVSCFGVSVSVMFHFMFVHYTISSVWVAEWPPFGNGVTSSLLMRNVQNTSESARYSPNKLGGKL